MSKKKYVAKLKGGNLRMVLLKLDTAIAIDDLESATFSTNEDRDNFIAHTFRARAILQRIIDCQPQVDK